MKKILLIFALLLMISSTRAVAPQYVSYQSVMRNANSQLVANKPIKIRLSILETSTTGTVVYSESQTPTTNANGLISIEIGAGSVLAGVFGDIDWSAGTHFLKTEVDPTGGNNFTIVGTSQLLSVPYALHANSADKLISPYYLGQEVDGGVVFNIYTGSDGKQHGLIVHSQEFQGQWGVAGAATGSTNMTDGYYNTNLMPTNATNSARNIVSALGSGWYLPSIEELRLLFSNTYFLYKSAGFTHFTFDNPYMSSNEVENNNTYCYGIVYGKGQPVTCVKFFMYAPGPPVNVYNGGNLYIRAIKAF